MDAIERQLLDYIAVDEGTFANVKGDKGGKTNYGVTERLARAHGYMGAMEDMPIETAEQILLDEYWVPVWSKLTDRPCLAIKLCDTEMNMPPAQGFKIAQRAVNRVAGASVLDVDGHLGPHSLQGLLDPLLPEEALLLAVAQEQAAHYVDLVSKVPGDQQFLRGWLNRAHRIPTPEGGSTHVQF